MIPVDYQDGRMRFSLLDGWRPVVTDTFEDSVRAFPMLTLTVFTFRSTEAESAEDLLSRRRGDSTEREQKLDGGLLCAYSRSWGGPVEVDGEKIVWDADFWRIIERRPPDHARL